LEHHEVQPWQVAGSHSPLPLDEGVLASARALKVGFKAAPVATAVPAAAEAFMKVLLESFRSSKKSFIVGFILFFSFTSILLPKKFT
jgi:hypothetical protein